MDERYLAAAQRQLLCILGIVGGLFDSPGIQQSAVSVFDRGSPVTVTSTQHGKIGPIQYEATLPGARFEMTTKPTTHKAVRREGGFRLPYPPKREFDEMTAIDHVYQDGINRYLSLHFGHPDTTLVVADCWIVAGPEFNRARAHRPDLLIAFDVSSDDYWASRGYIVSGQGKPPDFVL